MQPESKEKKLTDPFTAAKLKSGGLSHLYLTSVVVVLGWLYFFVKLVVAPTADSAGQFSVVLFGGITLLSAVCGFASMVGALKLTKTWNTLIVLTLFTGMVTTLLALTKDQLGLPIESTALSKAKSGGKD
jgi:hypothetical protein